MELAFRLFGFGYGSAPLENDHIFHHVHPKNYTFACYVPTGEYGGHTIRYDEFRRRVNENNPGIVKNKKIWFFGDSFTEASQVKWDSSFVGLIEQSTNYSVINFGTSSYSPLLYFLQLKHELSLTLTKPDFVVIQLYSNDVDDDDLYAKYAKFDSTDQPVSCDGGSLDWFTKISREFYIARVSKRVVLTLQYLRTKKQAPERSTENKIDNYVEQVPVISDNTRFAKSIKQIHNLLDDLSVKHIFFAIPSKYSCFSGNWNKPTFSSEFVKFMSDNKYPCVNMDSLFMKMPHPEKLFYKEDIHCNEKGNKLIASEIDIYLRHTNRK